MMHMKPADTEEGRCPEWEMTERMKRNSDQCSTIYSWMLFKILVSYSKLPFIHFKMSRTPTIHAECSI